MSDLAKSVADGAHQAVATAGGDRSKRLLDLRPHVLDRVQVRAVGRQVPDLRPGRRDQLSHPRTFVAGEVVQHDDLTAMQRRQQNPLDIDLESIAVDRPVQRPGSMDPVEADRREHGRGFPVARRGGRQQPPATRTTAVRADHVRLGPAFIDESQASRVDVRRVEPPLPAGLPYVGPVLLGGSERFFFSGRSQRSSVR